MDISVLVACVAAALALLVVGLLALVLHGRSALAQARSETADLRHRLDVLSEQLERQSAVMIRVDDPAYVITDAGRSTSAPDVSDALVLSATVGEPLVKALAFGHGVRRALSAESLNRIRFEVRREIRRSRKQRRRDMKDAWRRVQAEERTQPPRPADAA